MAGEAAVGSRKLTPISRRQAAALACVPYSRSERRQNDGAVAVLVQKEISTDRRQLRAWCRLDGVAANGD